MKRLLLYMTLTLTALQAAAEVRLPAVLSDGMILQRDKELCFWGWADSGEKVSLTWQGKTHVIPADGSGRWEISLPAMPAGGPHTLKVNDLTVSDILIGDVFLCSGQSNMELPVRRVTDMFAEEIGSYENKMIRQFLVPDEFDFCTEREDLSPTQWKACTLKNVMEFSALAYFFAKELHAATGVPVGIVNASWGGTPVEAWMSEEALGPYPRYLNEKKLYEDEGYCKRIKKLEGEEFHRWNTVLHGSDPGYMGDRKWYDPEYDDSGWKTVDMFSTDWGNNGLNPVAGSHWLRKGFSVPAGMAGKEAVVRLGCIVDADSVYVNGRFVGSTGYQYPPRIYRIPEGLLKEGANNITVRVTSNGGQPGFVREKPYKIICGDGEISLEGSWKYSLGAPMPKAPSMMFFCYKPVCLYNAMISPLRKLEFRSVLWYQGESNVDRRNEYAGLLKAMIADWRRTFDDPDLAFQIVELADFLHKDNIGGRKAWQEMREQQAKVADETENAVLVRNCDLGEWNDIHPLDKKTLGKRAAAAMLEQMKKY